MQALAPQTLIKCTVLLLTVTLLVAAGCASSTPAATATPRVPRAPETPPMVGMEVMVVRDVQVLSEVGEGGGNWRVLRPGPQNLYQGDTVATGRQGSGATLILAGGTSIRMGELTELRSTGLSRSGDRVRFELNTGVLEAKLPGGGLASFELITSTANLSDATGHWAVENRNGVVTVAVLDGSIEVQRRSGAQQEAVVVTSGQQIRVTRGQPIEGPGEIEAEIASRFFQMGQ